MNANSFLQLVFRNLLFKVINLHYSPEITGKKIPKKRRPARRKRPVYVEKVEYLQEKILYLK